MIGQLLAECTPGPVFDKVGVDLCWSSILCQVSSCEKTTNHQGIHMPVCVSLCLGCSLGACFWSDGWCFHRNLTTFRCLPWQTHPDHPTLNSSTDRLQKARYLSTTQNIEWKFIPERSPQFGGLLEAAVKSMKFHFKRVISDTKTHLQRTDNNPYSCLSSWPLTPLSCDDDGIEALTPRHFLIGQPLESIPDSFLSYRSMSLLKCWYLCQSLACHFWKRWSGEYLSSLRCNKFPLRNVKVGHNIVVLQEDNLIPTKWPLARVMHVHPGKDGLVCVVTVKTSNVQATNYQNYSSSL